MASRFKKSWITLLFLESVNDGSNFLMQQQPSLLKLGQGIKE